MTQPIETIGWYQGQKPGAIELTIRVNESDVSQVDALLGTDFVDFICRAASRVPKISPLAAKVAPLSQM